MEIELLCCLVKWSEIELNHWYPPPIKYGTNVDIDPPGITTTVKRVFLAMKIVKNRF